MHVIRVRSQPIPPFRHLVSYLPWINLGILLLPGLIFAARVHGLSTMTFLGLWILYSEWTILFYVALARAWSAPSPTTKVLFRTRLNRLFLTNDTTSAFALAHWFVFWNGKNVAKRWTLKLDSRELCSWMIPQLLVA